MQGQRALSLLMGLMVQIAFVSMPTVQAQTGTGTVVGFVTGDDGPYAHAEVSILCYGDPHYEGVVFTNEAGHFSLSGVPVGRAVSVVVYNKQGQVIGTGSGTIRFTGETTLIEIERVPIVRQQE